MHRKEAGGASGLPIVAAGIIQAVATHCEERPQWVPRRQAVKAGDEQDGFALPTARFPADDPGPEYVRGEAYAPHASLRQGGRHPTLVGTGR